MESQNLPYVASTSFILGGIFCLALRLAARAIRPLPTYIALISLFHFLEYYITARFQPSKVSPESFLLNNGTEYLAAHTLALLEASIEYLLFPNFKSSLPSLKLVGLAIAIAGQILRSSAMISARENFSHVIEDRKSKNHTLVTSGIYSVSRHPSYVGFFYWAIGTQILLLNPVSFLVFLVLLYKFFSRRIVYEEKTLVEFFGPDYIKYREAVPTRIPFLP